ncbi:glycosyltransferase [Rhodococcus antarcticus]|uniref:Glycosyltransferase n=1 Tax=Rhodococcus antarcticus TaxID=2987751 RepID=A0ABY6P1M2_9NOCA|nr:glycosyltransferase [Rhodococcus antarcticus]UZJ25547.1 glycosyltransferase [Rhodococcus antarcticus]
MHEGGVAPARAAAGTTGAEVAAVLVCHDGDRWLPEVLDSLGAQTAAPTVLVAVDTGSTDTTAALLAAALDAGRLSAVVTLARGAGFGAAVRAGLGRAGTELGGRPRWLWVLHDDSAPEPHCLESLLAAVDVSPSVGVVGPLCLDWDDPRVVVEAGLSTDASGQLQTGIGTDELDDGQFFQTSEVLAVSSAGALVDVGTFDALDGYDAALPLFGDDLDFGWRAQRSGKVVLCVPSARVRHVRAARRGLRGLEALGDSLGRTLPPGRAGARLAERAHGLRTFLVNTSGPSYRLGLLRLTVLAVLRSIGFLLLRNPRAARIERQALRWALGPVAAVGTARAVRAELFTTGAGTVRGLLTSRTTRVRNLVRGGVAGLARRQVRAELALGRLPEGATALTAGPTLVPLATPTPVPPALPVAPTPPALLPGDDPGPVVAPARPRPSPGPRGGAAPPPTSTAAEPGPGPQEPPPALAPAVEPSPVGGVPARPRRAAVAPPAGAVALSPTRRTAGLRRPVRQVTVAAAPEVAAPALEGARTAPAALVTPPAAPLTAALAAPDAAVGSPVRALRPSPVSRDPLVAAAQARAAAARTAALDADPGSVGDRALVVVRVGAPRVLRQLVLSPLVLLLVGLTLLSLVVHHARLGLSVSGGGLLPAPGGLTPLLSSYVAEWHAVAGGTAAPAPVLTGVLGVLGVLVGGADHAVALLLLAALPLAGASAYLATRSVALPAGWRAGVGAGWALLPVGAAGVGQGRLDTVLTQVLLPLVLAGVFSVLRGAPAGGAGRGGSTWLATAASTSLALAVVGSAAPVVHLLVVVLVLVGFVVVRPAPGPGTGVRRALALFAVVLLPVGLLVPWPAVVLTHPSVLLQGVGSPVPGADVGLLGLVGLGGSAPGVAGAAGLLVVLAALLLAVLAPQRRMVGGLAVAVLGGATAVAVAGRRSVPLAGGPEVPGSTGPALLLAAAGVLVVVVVGLQQLHVRGRSGSAPAPLHLPRRAGAALAALVLVVLAVGTGLTAADGVVRAGPAAALPGGLRAELEDAGALVLSVGGAEGPDRLGPASLPGLGDDDLAPVAGVLRRTAGWAGDLTGGDTAAASSAVAQVAAAGVGAVVLPPGVPATQPLLDTGLVSDAGSTTDGRAVLRVELATGGAQLLETALATAARTGGDPPTAAGSEGITAVPGGPPDLGVRVSGGADGRLLVLAAEDEPGWQVTVDGQAVAVARAYGHLVGVALPGPASEVVVTRSTVLRSLLLLGQGAVLLFTLFVAVPPRRRED